jgi:hypothetical protein
VIASVIAFVVFAVLFLAVVFVTRLGSTSEMSGQRGARGPSSAAEEGDFAMEAFVNYWLVWPRS